ncbi:hypothetical protein [Polaromonas aquatica]|uniref:hypothetical protein n=1 Tax=Polaromonas aquatica TaxID=332657 RepID=UPI003D6507F5
MQKVQMGGGAISPAVTAHVQKSAMQPAQAKGNSKVSATTLVGGGTISPALKKHLAPATMGGGVISPNVTRPVAQSAKVAMGGGIIHPNVSKHLQAQ